MVPGRCSGSRAADRAAGGAKRARARDDSRVSGLIARTVSRLELCIAASPAHLSRNRDSSRSIAEEERMTAQRPCEFFLIRYVPDPMKGEFVNIGVLLRDLSGPQPAPAYVRFTRDWARVRCMDPGADIEMLEALEQELTQRLEERREDMPYVLKTLEDSLSNGLQITEARACLAETAPAMLAQLMELYVESRRRETASRISGRQKLVRSMRSAFERAGVWNLMHKRIAAAQYTHP